MSKWPTRLVKPLLCARSLTPAYSTPVLSSYLLTTTLPRSIERVRNRLNGLLLCCAWWERRMRARSLWSWEVWWFCESTVPTAHGGRCRGAVCLWARTYLKKYIYNNKSDTWASWRAFCERASIMEKLAHRACFDGIPHRYNQEINMMSKAHGGTLWEHHLQS